MSHIRQLTMDDVRFSVIKLAKCSDVVRIRCSLKCTEFVSVTKNVHAAVWDNGKHQFQLEMLEQIQAKFEETYKIVEEFIV